MFVAKTTNHRVALWGAVLAIVLVPSMLPAQGEIPATPETPTSEELQQDPPLDPNPTRRSIYPRQDQSYEQQFADQQDCYLWACDQTDWDPYQAYDDLVADGYALALNRKDLEQGLIYLAAEGAEIGAVAGDIAGRPGKGATIGAAIAVARALIHSGYLNEPDDPEAQRAISRYERDLNSWDRKYAACLRRKGYQVP